MSSKNSHQVQMTSLGNTPSVVDHDPPSRPSSINKMDIEYCENTLEVPGAVNVEGKVDHFGTQVGYPPKERALVRKLDWHIIPILFAMYYMNKTDQNAIANARLNNLEKNLHLKPNQFNICVILGIWWSAIALGWSSGRFNERTWHITAGMIVALVSFVIAASTLNTAARYISCFLFATGAYSANSIIIGWVSATCGQTPEKKAAALSIMNCFSMASFIYTPYLYPASSGPRYRMAMSANAAFVTGVVVCTWGMRTWRQSMNRNLKRSGNAEGRLLYAY